MYANFKAWYDGNLGHAVKLQQWNYTTSAWVNVTSAAQDFPDAASEQSYQFLLLDDPNFISGGQIQLRIVHVSAGNPTHNFHIDYLYLSLSGLPSASVSPSRSISPSRSASASVSPSASISPSASESASPSEAVPGTLELTDATCFGLVITDELQPDYVIVASDELCTGLRVAITDELYSGYNIAVSDELCNSGITISDQ